MTRLTFHDLSGLSNGLEDYDLELRDKTGHSLKGIALAAAGLSEQAFAGTIENRLFAVVPITLGQGTIPGFCEAVQDIVSFLGCRAEITSSPDVGGLAEAFASQADIVFCADDFDFIAINSERKSVVHNNQATAKAYVTALKLMTSLSEGRVLVLGCGQIGQASLAVLLGGDQPVAVYDPDGAKAELWYQSLSPGWKELAEILAQFPKNLREFAAVIDATPAGNILGPENIPPHLFLAAPGVPLGLTPEAHLRHGHRVIHDPLQLGVAAMVSLSVKRILSRELEVPSPRFTVRRSW